MLPNLPVFASDNTHYEPTQASTLLGGAAALDPPKTPRTRRMPRHGAVTPIPNIKISFSVLPQKFSSLPFYGMTLVKLPWLKNFCQKLCKRKAGSRYAFTESFSITGYLMCPASQLIFLLKQRHFYCATILEIFLLKCPILSRNLEINADNNQLHLLRLSPNDLLSAFPPPHLRYSRWVCRQLSFLLSSPSHQMASSLDKHPR